MQSWLDRPISEEARDSHADTSPVMLPVARHVTTAPLPETTGLPCELVTVAEITVLSPGETVTVYGSGESTTDEAFATVAERIWVWKAPLHPDAPNAVTCARYAPSGT
ncbi:hypothetical protein LBMAG38_15330 [Chloroflexota bacterium]|nr:hypothetical protein LBMAG38_15330 [Chloroflexota bacterium]